LHSPKPKPKPARSTAPSPSSKKRWRRPNAGYRAFDAELHRVRAETLLKRDSTNPEPAEEALLTAIAVAKKQATRSFELRSALSLARLYQSTGRPADAHAILAPALEGFAPTPDMPENREAEELLASLAQ
jgi:predicted ATPase